MYYEKGSAGQLCPPRLLTVFFIVLSMLISSWAGAAGMTSLASGNMETSSSSKLKESKNVTIGTHGASESQPSTSGQTSSEGEVPANKSDSAFYEITWDVLSNGGSINGQSADYILAATISQTAIGLGTGNGFVLKEGFWQDGTPRPTGCCDTPGDANSDGQTNIGDAVFVVNFVFRSGPLPDCGLEADANGDCGINVGDAVALAQFVFKGLNEISCGCAY